MAVLFYKILQTESHNISFATLLLRAERIHAVLEAPNGVQKRLPEKINQDAPEIIKNCGEIIIPNASKPCSQKAKIAQKDGI